MSDFALVRVQQHLPIPVRDGVRLSAAVHWPAGSPGDGMRRPVLFEYHPYRKDDRSAARSFDHDYFASHGFISIRLDVRGSGSSEGENTDEYMPVETTDGYDAVEWLAKQPWCNGNVGMFGSSYGGFTCFQVASLAPPHLKAIAPLYATDDRYTDDCHYKGGAFKAYYDTGTYGTMMIALNALPPDPGAFPDTWTKVWRERIEKNEPYMQTWLSHQTNDAYWRPGSLRGQYGKVKAATFIIGGWQDGYPNPPGRAYAALSCPRKLLIGPWNHSRPDVAIPGPRIHYLNEIRRWFDLWLKGADDGISKEPPVTFFVQHYDRPDPLRRDTTGEWRSDRSWPPEDTRPQKLIAVGENLAEIEDPAAKPRPLVVDHSAGLQGGLWSGGLPFGLPADQRKDDARSLAYTSHALLEPLTIAGHVTVNLRASSSAPVAMFVAKLEDVAPDGAVALVSRGILNGTRRSSLTKPEPMVPGQQYDLAIELDATCWRFDPGHKVRLAISGSDFPNSWPTPLPATITISWSSLTLPVILRPDGVRAKNLTPETPASTLMPAKNLTRAQSYLPPPVKQPSTAKVDPDIWQVTEDVLGAKTTLHIRRGSGAPTPADGWTYGSDELFLTASRTDPADVVADGTHTARLDHPVAGKIESTARQVIRSDNEYFHWSVDLTVTRDGKPFATRKWEKSFRRELL